MRVNRKYNAQIQSVIDDVIDKNMDTLSSVQHLLIPNTYTYQNSMNLLIGKQRCGKSTMIIKEIMKICDNLPEAHMVVYINKSGKPDDSLFEKLKSVIPVPILCVSHKDAVPALQNLDSYKFAYKTIKSNHLENKLPEEYLSQFDEHLHVNNLDLPFLQTILFFEDTANSALLKDKYILDVLGRCAHYQVICFLASQYWKSIPSTAKENVSTIYFYGGASNREFYYLVSQINIEEDHKILYHQYKKLDVSDKMIVDNYSRQILFVDRDN